MLTNWEQMSPDELADALAGDDHSHQFRSLSAYRLENGKVVSIAPLWWENGPSRKLKALSDRIKATEITHETGYQDWQQQSLLSLPAGVFVWKDEYVPLYERKFNPESITFLSSNTSSGVMAPDEQQRRTVLDFNPFIDDPETARVVMEEFDTERPCTQPQAETKPAPEVEAAASELLPVTTGDVAFAFDGLHGWNEKQWKKSLGDKPKWLAACIVIPGIQGKLQTRWNPVLIGGALLRNGHGKVNNIRARFQTKPELRPWLEAWNTYEADNLDTP